MKGRSGNRVGNEKHQAANQSRNWNASAMGWPDKFSGDVRGNQDDKSNRSGHSHSRACQRRADEQQQETVKLNRSSPPLATSSPNT
jgi:hypothetical protein